MLGSLLIPSTKGMRARLCLLSLPLLLLGAPALHAAIFPDVPDGHMFQEPIEQLSIAGVVKGNPDGTYAPKRSVNRAEMLTLLYRAVGRIPDPGNRLCFPDIEPGAWHEGVVCDAAANKFVAGYATGRFEPGRAVNRVEALKMIHMLFGFTIDQITDEMKDVVKFVDVSTSAWYTGYLANAHIIGILPIAGQDGSRFYPDQELTREEAAAYIYNALQARIKLDRAANEARNEDEEVEEADAAAEDDASDNNQVATRSSSSSSSSSAPANMLDVTFPFSGGGKFDGKKPFSYTFTLDSQKTVATTVKLQSGQPGGIRCTLFLISDSGFADRYHIGIQEGSACYLVTTLSKGNYQLQIQPTKDDVTYSVNSDLTLGDGNDGFDDANVISPTSTRTYVLESGNFEDWYTFFVSGGHEEGKRMMVELTNSQNLRCIVYAMNDVDLYGFTGPECNQFYNYPPGTYYVSVARKASKDTRLTYTIRLRE